MERRTDKCAREKKKTAPVKGAASSKILALCGVSGSRHAAESQKGYTNITGNARAFLAGFLKP